MTNAYLDVMKANFAVKQYEKANKTKADNLILLIAKDSVAQLLTDCNVNAQDFNRALYMQEKLVKTTSALLQEHVTSRDFNDNVIASLKTVILCANANEKLHKTDIDCAMSKDQKKKEERKDFIYQRSQIQTDSTIAAQSQQCLDMLRIFKIAREVSRDVYEIDAENKIFQLAKEKLANVYC
jgi:hypothetical protein